MENGNATGAPASLAPVARRAEQVALNHLGAGSPRPLASGQASPAGSTTRDWPIGWAPASQAGQAGPIPASRTTRVWPSGKGAGLPNQLRRVRLPRRAPCRCSGASGEGAGL